MTWFGDHDDKEQTNEIYNQTNKEKTIYPLTVQNCAFMQEEQETHKQNYIN